LPIGRKKKKNSQEEGEGVRRFGLALGLESKIYGTKINLRRVMGGRKNREARYEG